ncbi:MAG: Spx/MgsR family RNA polymerase-binding regulatory protein [Candidatus Methylopumilus sp.]|jgi:Spx/MgsR family transcriptional regulator|nr:Spx/MgsR family RNA polymerase-binding regulatory protein [Betaproteobacteria bacterium]
MMVVGIKNCSTVKKALIWFDSHKIKYEFFDLKKEALDEATLTAWFKTLPNHLTWEMLINKSGMTWRNLTDREKKLGNNKETAIQLILEKPTVMKRPLVAIDKKVVSLGFNEATFKQLFKK